MRGHESTLKTRAVTLALELNTPYPPPLRKAKDLELKSSTAGPRSIVVCSSTDLKDLDKVQLVVRSKLTWAGS